MNPDRRPRPTLRRSRVARIVVLTVAVVFLAAGCGMARPLPPVYEPPVDALGASTVLLFGDSLMNQTEPQVVSQSAEFGLPLTFIDEAVGGRGILSMWGFTDPPRESLQGYLAEHEPDYVVFEFVGNYQQSMAAPGYEEIVHGTDEFYAAWMEMYQLMIGDIVAAGAVPITVIPPPMGPGSNEQEVRNALTDAYLEATAESGHPIIDWAEALSARDCIVWIDTGKSIPASVPICYADELRYVGFDIDYTIRTTDRLHFAEHGKFRAARWVVAGLSALVAAPDGVQG